MGNLRLICEKAVLKQNAGFFFRKDAVFVFHPFCISCNWKLRAGQASGWNCMPAAVKCLYRQNTASQGYMKHSVHENPGQMFFLFLKTDVVMLSWSFCVLFLLQNTGICRTVSDILKSFHMLSGRIFQHGFS